MSENGWDEHKKAIAQGFEQNTREHDAIFDTIKREIVPALSAVKETAVAQATALEALSVRQDRAEAAHNVLNARVTRYALVGLGSVLTIFGGAAATKLLALVTGGE